MTWVPESREETTMGDQEPVPLPTSPMAETCKGIMERPFSGVTLIVPGLIFIGLGLVIFIEPRILPGSWLQPLFFWAL